MRPLLSVLLCLVLAACSGLSNEPARILSLAPTPNAIEDSVAVVAKAAKWVGPPEASPVRRAHLLAPADWIVCARSGARDLSPPYAIFFNGNSVQHFRLAVEIDDCLREPYVLVVITGAPSAVVAPPPQPEPKVVPNPFPTFGTVPTLSPRR